MRNPCLLATAALTALWASTAIATDGDALSEVKHQLQQGVDHGDVAQVLEARARFQVLVENAPRSALPAYWVAVADWRAAALLLNGAHPNREQARRHCEAGIAAAERALALDPKFGGALAVKVGLQGLSTTFLPPAILMTLGPQMESDLARARRLSTEDPRVSLLDGMNTLHKPAFVGGGPRPALAKLEHAIEQFAAERPTDPAAPDWGRDDAYLWAGRAAMQLGEPALARRFFVRALEANPDHAWVRGTLLPEAERAMAADSTEQGVP